jgi:hypothetical protein
VGVPKLDRLERDCQGLRGQSFEEQELVAELRSFIVSARETIEEVSSEPEVLYSGIDTARCNSLRQISTQINSNQMMLKSLLQSQKTLAPSKARSEMSVQSKQSKHSLGESVESEHGSYKKF